MQLTGTQISTLQDALLASFYSESELAQMVRMQLDQNLAGIAGGGNLRDTVFGLIGWAERTGNLKKLVEGSHSHNPGNPKLKLWLDTHGDALDAKPTLDSAGASPQQPSADAPWWTQLKGLNIDTGGGDLIITTIGDGARNVAAGKNIQQQITEVLGEPTSDDAEIIANQFAALESTVSTLDEQMRSFVEMQVGLLKSEFSKVEKDETPSDTTITQVGDWLLDNAPALVEELTTLFGLPAVGKVLGKAGETAIDWARKKFGS